MRLLEHNLNMAQLKNLLGDRLQETKGASIVVESLTNCKVVGLYFSAHWCPPCRAFTPMLAQWYKENKRDDFEIVFISSDRDEAGFNDYFDTMPWKALPFADREKKVRTYLIISLTQEYVVATGACSTSQTIYVILSNEKLIKGC